MMKDYRKDLTATTKELDCVIENIKLEINRFKTDGKPEMALVLQRELDVLLRLRRCSTEE